MKMIEKYFLTYNFENHNEEITEYLNKVLKKSTTYFAFQRTNGQIVNLKNEYVSMLEYLNDFEAYLFYIYTTNNSNFDNILKTFKDKIEVISVLPPEKRGLFGEALIPEKTLLINPDLDESASLTKRERTRLYVAHELGHFINAPWMESSITFIDSLYRSGKITQQEEGDQIYAGFSLLDEAITQNRAEAFTYSFARKFRRTERKHTTLFGGNYYNTSFDFYGEFEFFAIRFGRTLSEFKHEPRDSYILRKLCNKATSPDFVKLIIMEYANNDQLDELIAMAIKMGTIKIAKYHTFGIETKDSKAALEHSKKAAKEFERIANEVINNRGNRDGR